MNNLFGYRKYLRALGLILIGLLLSIFPSQILFAEDGIELPSLSLAAFEEFEITNPLAQENQVEAAQTIVDPDLTPAGYANSRQTTRRYSHFERTSVGYDNGFVIASRRQSNFNTSNAPFLMRITGWGQLRHTIRESDDATPDLNQFQLKRARLVFSGNAYSPDFTYFVQLDGRSSSGDDMRLLDYFLTYDLGHHALGCERGQLGFKTGKYKIPFTMARYLSGREFEFTDRSMASMYFDANRSLAWGLFGESINTRIPWDWEVAIFNGLVTGGAETGSSGTLDDNFAYSARIFAYPTGDWGDGELADFRWHDTVATRIGAGVANTKINSDGLTEFNSVRVVDSGETLASLLMGSVDEYTVNLFSLDYSQKWRGWSLAYEYYFRHINDFQGAAVPSLFDHGFWFQLGKFVIAERIQLLARWSRVEGNSGTLGVENQSAEEIAVGFVWYFRRQNAKLTIDATYLDGAPIDSASLDISPGNIGWLVRSQIQIAF